jgi:hypothetical protein
MIAFCHSDFKFTLDLLYHFLKVIVQITFVGGERRGPRLHVRDGHLNICLARDWYVGIGHLSVEANFSLIQRRECI